MITPIKEQDLIDLGFDREDYKDTQEKYHFYMLDFFSDDSFVLISNCSDEIKNDQWEVRICDHNGLIIEDVNLLSKFIEVVNKNKKHYNL